MKFRLLFCLLLISFRSFSYEEAPNQSKNYLDFKNLMNSKALNPPTLFVYDNKKITGEPIIKLAKEGLFIKGKLVCKWYKEYGEEVQNRVLSEVTDGSPCTHPPIFTNYIENNPYMLWIEVEDLENNEHYQISFEGKPAYIEKKKNLDFSFELSKNRKSKINRPVEQAAYEKVVQDNGDLKEFIAKLNTCFKNEDENCVTSSDSNIAASYKWYLEKICENDNPLVKKTQIKLGKYCGDLGDPKELQKPHNKKQREKDKAARIIFQKEFWNNFRSCFHNDDPFKLSGRAYEPASANPINVEIYPQDESYTRCTIFGERKKGEKILWRLSIR